MKIKTLKLKQNASLLTTLKGSLISLMISLVCILAFAFIIKLTSIADGLIKPINQIIKVASILLGCFGVFKKHPEKILLRGLLIGVLYTILAFVLFSILNGSFEFSKSILIDVLFGGAVGLISAVIFNVFHK